MEGQHFELLVAYALTKICKTLSMCGAVFDAFMKKLFWKHHIHSVSSLVFTMSQIMSLFQPFRVW